MTLHDQRTAASKTVQPISPFVRRHIGPEPQAVDQMLQALGFADLDAFIQAVVPGDILDPEPPCADLPEGVDEAPALAELRTIASCNQLSRSLIGLGYFETVTPALIQRQVLENPSWYTAYTPYQAEIAQGRLVSLLCFLTLISALTGLPIANASLLDEATAAAEACR